MGTMERSYIKKGKINQYVERYRATNQNGQSDNKTKRETLKKKKRKNLSWSIQFPRKSWVHCILGYSITHIVLAYYTANTVGHPGIPWFKIYYVLYKV